MVLNRVKLLSASLVLLMALLIGGSTTLPTREALGQEPPDPQSRDIDPADFNEPLGPPQPLRLPDLQSRKHPKLASQLVAFALRNEQLANVGLAIRAGRDDLLTPELRGLVEIGAAQIDASGRVRVEIRGVASSAASIQSAVNIFGGVNEGSYKDLVQATVPIAALEGLARLAEVQSIRLPERAEPSIVGQGVSATGATAWHSGSINGAGVKVGVLDLGFSGYASLLGSELPASVTTRNCRADTDISGGGEVHGAAVAEIVHEMAPSATLYFASFRTTVEMAACANWLVSQGVDVINMSAGFTIGGPGNGTGDANDIVASAISAGVTWVNAAGNEADGHWRGSWSDPDANNSINFSGADETQTIVLSAGYPLQVQLKWNDAWGASCNNYDLLLYDSNLVLLEFSAWTQDCNDDPWEALAIVAPYTGTYHIAVGRYLASGTSVFNLYAPTLEYLTAGYSLIQPADNSSAISVGAVPWNSLTSIEPFSSQGPTEDGRVKPDLVAPDRVSGASYGPYPSGFPGTSAASPHVAGAAALVLQANPSFTPAQVKSFLEGRATGLGAAGKDNVFGSGLLTMGIAPTIPTPTFTATPTRTSTPTPTATPTSVPGPDTDLDGVPDASDNCPTTPNPTQLNTDRLPITTPGVVPIDTTLANNDALGDACDPDDDNDGIADADEPAGCNGSGPLNALIFDTDGDRTGDAAECALGSNPADPLSKPQRPMPGDTDGDGLPDTLETTIGSNPLVVDTDGDGINDGIEYRGYNTSPIALDTDNDACNDDTEITDITGSRKTDVIDLFLIAGSFGFTTRPNLDITKDGNINVIDLFLVAGNFTQTFCPPQ